MSLVTREIRDAAKDSQTLTYIIEINNLRQKLKEAKTGEKIETGVFSISWSTFKVGVFLRGADEDSRDHLSVYLYNESDWLVKAEYQVRVRNQSFWSSSVKVFEARRKSRNAWGQPRSIPHSRCKHDDLLTPSGSLIIEIKVNLLDELVVGGNLERRRELKEITESLNQIKLMLRSFSDNSKIPVPSPRSFSLNMPTPPPARQTEIEKQEQLKKLCQESNHNDLENVSVSLNNNGKELSEKKIKMDAKEKNLKE